MVEIKHSGLATAWKSLPFMLSEIVGRAEQLFPQRSVILVARLCPLSF